MSNTLLGFTKKAMAFWRARFSPIEEHTRRTAEATERINAARGARGSGLIIEGDPDAEPVPVTLADSGSTDNSVSSEQLPAQLGIGGGLLVEGTPDGLPVAVAGDVNSTPSAVPAKWKSGRLAFGSITSSYALLLELPAPARILTFLNSTDTEVVFSFDNGTTGVNLPAYSSQDMPLRDAGVSEARSIYVKHNGTAPLSGAAVVNAVT